MKPVIDASRTVVILLEKMDKLEEKRVRRMITETASQVRKSIVEFTCAFVGLICL